MTPLEGFDVPLAHPAECPQHSVRIPSICTRRLLASLEGFEPPITVLPHIASPEGLEPPTFGSEDRRSIQLSYGDAISGIDSNRCDIRFTTGTCFLLNLYHKTRKKIKKAGVTLSHPPFF